MAENGDLRRPVAAVGIDGPSAYAHAIAQRINQGLANSSSLPPLQVSVYRTIAQHIISHMSEEAMKRWLASVVEVRYYPDLASLIVGTGLGDPRLRGGLDEDCHLHLNGGDSFAETAHVHTHEFAHGIDGYDSEISSSPEWRQAWQRDIVDSRSLSQYSQANAHEGFAEFGRLVLSGLHPLAIEEDYPGCHAVWRTHGLLS